MTISLKTGGELAKAIREAVDIAIASGDYRTKAEIAEKFGVTPPSLQIWMKNGAIGKDKLAMLWTFFLPYVGLEHWGFPDMRKFVKAENRRDYVPLLTKVQAGDFTPTDDQSIAEYIPCYTKHSEKTFALKVSGLSMANGMNGISFPPGSTIFVDAQREVRNGDFVVAMLENGDATLKQFYTEDGRRFLKALNPEWNPQLQEISDAVAIVGVVIAKLEEF